MKRFKNILVGVDLGQGESLVSDDLPAASAEAVRRANWLAKLNGARLSYLYALDLSYGTRHFIEEAQQFHPTVLDSARAALQDLAKDSAKQGIDGHGEAVFGKSWVEIIRRVLRENHDLVIVGTRNLRGLTKLVLGSTGTKLLRKCPCPVWVTKPQKPDVDLYSVLVATDLSAVSDLATELAVSMAALQKSELHVLHVFDSREASYLRQARAQGEQFDKYREASRAEAVTHIRNQLATLGADALENEPQLHIVEGVIGAEILEHIERHDIQLLVMGTIARTGIPGVLTGNTAERVLSEVPCSVLAVKPPDFHCPIAAE